MLKNKIAALSLVLVLGLTLETTLAPFALAVEEATLPEKLSTEILPYFRKAKFGTFSGKDGIPIAYRVFPPSDGQMNGSKAIILLNGRSEFMQRYAELIYDLKDSGYSIYAMDHRGQGESGRLLSDSRLGHVVSFHDYSDDIGTFVNEIVRKDHPSEIHVIAHSMGAAAVTIYAIEHPDVFKSMVLSGPMYLPNLNGYPQPIALLLGEILSYLGRSEYLAPGRSADEWKDPFEKNRTTSSRIRYDAVLQMLLDRPSLAVGGPTIHWVLESIRAGKWLRRSGSGLKTPTLILQAEKDQIVKNSAENQVCDAALNCKVVVIPGSQHEIYDERDPIRTRAIQLTLDYFDHGITALRDPASER